MASNTDTPETEPLAEPAPDPRHGMMANVQGALASIKALGGYSAHIAAAVEAAFRAMLFHEPDAEVAASRDETHDSIDAGGQLLDPAAHAAHQGSLAGTEASSAEAEPSPANTTADEADPPMKPNPGSQADTEDLQAALDGA